MQVVTEDSVMQVITGDVVQVVTGNSFKLQVLTGDVLVLVLTRRQCYAGVNR